MARITREQQQSMDLIDVRPTTFVPAARERPQPVEVIMPGPTVGPAWETALQPAKNDSRDSLSAADRARGRLLDSIPAHAGILILSGFGALAFHRIADAERLDSFLAFLFLTGCAVLFYNANDIAERLRHTNAGIEREKIRTAAEMYKAQLEYESQIRRQALEMQLRLLEDRQHDDD